MGTGAAIMAVMFWKRDGIIAFFEIDERMAAWGRQRSGATAAAALSQLGATQNISAVPRAGFRPFGPRFRFGFDPQG